MPRYIHRRMPFAEAAETTSAFLSRRTVGLGEKPEVLLTAFWPRSTPIPEGWVEGLGEPWAIYSTDLDVKDAG